MKKVIAFIICLFIAVNCGPGRKVKVPNNFYMKTVIENVYSYGQLDSICISDGISTSPREWDKIYFQTADNIPIEEYSYIFKRGDTLFIYTVIPVNNDSIRVTKRIQVEK